MPPPSLVVKRGKDGLVEIRPPGIAGFSWKPHGQGDPSASTAVRIHYTLDGGEPTAASPVYQNPLSLPRGGRVRAVAIASGKAGPPCDVLVAIDPSSWSVRSCSSEQSDEFSGRRAIDGNRDTFWHTRWTPAEPHPHQLEIDLGEPLDIGAVTYLPRQDRAVPDGMVEAGEISFSRDGRKWSRPQPFRLGNLVNDPSERTILLDRPLTGARFMRFTSRAGAEGKPYAAAAEIGLLPRD
jgi:alpha-L-fucosidase